LHKIDAPFGKGADNDNVMERSGLGTCIFLKDLIGWEFFNDLDAIFEYGRPKITNTEDFLSYSHPRKMKATSSKVTVI
jgi:hypothetical protein